MGKRKERRLTAKTAANRRVKLDLLAEPSGDFGDSSNREEIGVGGNGENHAGSPNSPSSSEFQHFNKISGQRPENPLLLLGQYSDEEVDEESSKEIIHDAREKPPTVLDEQVKVDNNNSTSAVEDENCFTEEINQENNEPSSMDVLANLEKTSVIDDKPDPPHRDAHALDPTSVSLTTDTHTTVDMDSGWKMVLHEESNSYYYWNVVTGETSWEAPVALPQGNESAYDPKSGSEIEEIHSTSVDMQANNKTTNGMVLEAKEINGSRSESKVHNENGTNIMENDIDGFATRSFDGLSNAEAHHDASVMQDMSGHVYNTTGGESSDSFRLLQLGGNLSERLKSLKGSEGFSDQISKLMFELDIRLADIKSLVPYGSSLLPFWLHSENKLKNLESSINNEVLKHSQFSNTGELNKPEKRFQENIGESHESASPADIEPNVGHNSVEDDDMDVEMEVEDTAVHSTDESGLHLDQSTSPSPHVHLESRGSEPDSDVPLPPSDDWIPPPPPDEEPLPPPPPDEPTEPAFLPLPSETQTTQPYSYGEQYSFTYPGSGFDYYGQTNTGISSNGYYVDASGSHITAPLPTVYYAPVLNPEPTTYYTLQDGGATLTTPSIGCIETSGLQNPVYENIISDQPKSSTVVPSTLASTHVLESSSVPHDVSVVSAPDVASTETVPKVQPKVTRNKKRTVAAVPTLRSNKKVSGLVDKWKAVKEELHEDEEEEPENALEVLEKKRQRAIEQWHAQQIASGEAKDNANFQPLGGDWRERVRRKRAKKSTQAEENLANATDETKQQPDLVELSKQLPTGWQAYWDESSKLVYYGNSKTSETTWIKPAK